MNTLIILNNSWYSRKGISVKGYAFNKSDIFLEGEAFVSRFDEIKNFQDFKVAIKELNGLFSVIINTEKECYLATDITRTYPIFYYKNKNEWVVSDNANTLKKTYNLEIDKDLSDEFLFSGYMIENKTLVKEIRQIPAHEVVSLADTVYTESYFSFATKIVEKQLLQDYQKELLQCYELIAKRLTKALNNRTAVLPLSGGYDSRLVLTLLKEQKYKKIICFSYGTKSSYEVSVASDVAKAMGVKYIKIEYSKKFILESLDKKEFVDYENFAGNLSSLPHIQDFLSVKFLKKNNLIPKDSVFIPGIAGDIFAGTQIPVGSDYEMTQDDILKLIKIKYLNFKAEKFKSNINVCSDCYGYSVIENFCVKEKVPKFVANSIKIYEYLGYGFLLPLMDKDLLLFFSRVPMEMKKRNFKTDYILEENLYDSTNFILFKNYKVDICKKDSRIFLKNYINLFKKTIRLKVDSLNNFDIFIVSLEKIFSLTTSFKDKKNINLALSEIYLHIVKMSA